MQFETHNRLDYHDFKQFRDKIDLPPRAIDSINNVKNFELLFKDNGESAPYDLYQQYIDDGYDMVYIRLHCRENGAGIAEPNGSRFHLNCISNQEVNFESIERESRFQTDCHNIGIGAASLHSSARAGDGNAAKNVPVLTLSL